MEDLLGLGKVSDNGLETIKLIYPDVFQPSLKKVGLALETVFYFQKHMDNYKEKLDKIPEENIGLVPPEIGLPILDELLRVTNDDLADLFTNLLVNASTVEYSRYAHPSFINVLKSLSSDEAKIVKYLNDSKGSFAYVRFNRVDIDGTIVPLNEKYNNLENLVQLTFKENAMFYIRNLVNLGILESVDVYLASQMNIYEALEKDYQHVTDNLQKEIDNLDVTHSLSKSTITLTRGRERVTKYGEEFLKSITLRSDKKES